MTDKTQEALKLALETLEKIGLRGWVERKEDAITAIREALAEQPAQQQEPVGRWVGDCIEWTENPYKFRKGQPLYTSPQSKPWVGLTDEERDAILNREFKQWWSRHDAVCRAIEAKLKEKNQ